jgi:hypothetical protein
LQLIACARSLDQTLPFQISAVECHPQTEHALASAMRQTRQAIHVISPYDMWALAKAECQVKFFAKLVKAQAVQGDIETDFLWGNRTVRSCTQGIS